MTSSIRIFAGLAVLLLLFPFTDTSAQQTKHAHPVLNAIDQAHQEGRLTIDERVLYKFYALQSPAKLPADFQPEQSQVIKCGTPVFADLHRNRNQLSPATVNEIENMMVGTQSQANQTYSSPSGNFLIHYENDDVPPADNNSNNVPDYVESVAAAADSSLSYQVHELGFTNPILQNSQYDVTIDSLIDGLYGFTRPLGNTTDIFIDNDFQNGFPPNDHPDGDQIGAVNVTMAHEFKHAIQFANNQWQGSAGSIDWSEMDATLMEEVTYDNVNDYYNYIFSNASIFLSPEDPIPSSYQGVSFFIFFDEFFGTDFWVDVWQNEIKPNPTMNFLDAINNQTTQRGPSFPHIFTESHLWHYASGPNNTAPNYGFKERNNYPDPTISETITSTQSSLPSQQFVRPNAARYFDIDPFGNESKQVLITLTADQPDFAAGAIAYFKDGSSDTFLGTSGSGSSKLRLETTWNWNQIDQIGLVAVNTNQATGINLNIATASYEATLVRLKQNYPNPFNGTTTIEFSLQQNSNVQLKLFDVTGRLVRTIIDGPRSAGIYKPSISSNRLASGIYFYQLVTDQRTKVKKMTLIK